MPDEIVKQTNKVGAILPEYFFEILVSKGNIAPFLTFITNGLLVETNLDFELWSCIW